MKFAHLADCHIGSWRDPLLSELNMNAFESAIDRIIDENVDFLSISGDLFNTSLPSIEKLKAVVIKLKELKDIGIPVYMIAGSHDFSPSGKTMLDVLEEAGLIVNVAKGEEADEKLSLKFTIDKKTGAKITGLLGKKGGLEKDYYEVLNRELLENEEGFKIFMFHSLLSELKPKQLENVDSQPISLLPKKFDFYLGGHPHFVFSEHIQDYGIVCYPGPIFPNNFKEIEDLGHGGFFIIENGIANWIPIKLKETERINLDCEHKSPEGANDELSRLIEGKDFTGKIVTLRASGVLETGKPSDINFNDVVKRIKERGAYAVLKNTSALQSKEFTQISTELENQELVEEKLVDEMITEGELGNMNSQKVSKQLMNALDTERQEGETVSTYEKRVVSEIEKILEMDRETN